MSTSSQDLEETNSKGTCCQRFAASAWNSEKGTCFGRTPASWGKLAAFYLVYYVCLSAFVAIVFFALLATLPEDKPKYYAKYDQKKRDAILVDPGMGMVPRDVTLLQIPILDFSKTSASSYSGYVAEISHFIQAYDNANGNISVRDNSCNTANFSECAVVDESLRDPCKASNNYGYSSGTPCILLKLNKIIGFKPTAYSSTPSVLSSLVDTGHGSATMYSTTVSSGTDNVIITCQEENAKKRKSAPAGHLTSVAFHPNYGLPFDCFPYCGKKYQTGEDTYLQPYVAAQLTVALGQRVSIWCRVWYEDVVQRHKDKIGSMRFTLRVNG